MEVPPRSQGKGVFRDGAPDALDDPFGVVRGHRGEDEQEFVSTVPPPETRLPEGLPDQGPEGFEDRVPLPVAVRIVDLLQLVEVAQTDGQRDSLSLLNPLPRPFSQEGALAPGST